MEYLKVFLINKVTILLMSAKMATPGLLQMSFEINAMTS